MKILYVEDNPHDADLTRRHLARDAPHINLDLATTVAEARARLDTVVDYDLALVDLNLPNGNGLDLLTTIRDEALPLAVVILTGTGNQEAAVAALKVGADDYVIKREEYLQQLPQILTAAVERFRAETARKSRPLRVLYVEHNALDVDLTRRHLAQNAPHIRLEVVPTVRAALTRLPETADAFCPYDVLLVDYNLPGLNALEALKVIRTERKLHLPVVMVTGQGDEALAVQALRLGAADYMVKNPGYLFGLPAVLENAYHRIRLEQEQAALKASERKYRQLFRHMQSGFALHRMVTDEDGAPVDYIFLEVNHAFLEMTGLKEEEVIGKRVTQVLPGIEDEPADWINVYGKVAQSGEPIEFEQFSQQLQRWYSVLAYCPTPGHFATLVVDVTDQKQSERKIRLTAQRLSLATEAACLGIWELDLVRNTLIWDEQMFALYQVEPETFTGFYEDWEQCVHPEDLSDARVAVAEAIAGKRPFHTQFRIVWPDGQIRHLEAHAVVQHAAEGAPRRMIGVNWDITEQKQAEAERVRLLEQIREQANRVQQIIDTVPEGVVLLDGQGKVMLANPVAQRQLQLLTGNGEQEVITHLGERPLTELLIPPSDGLWHEIEAGACTFELIAQPLIGDPTERWVLVIADVTEERANQRYQQAQERLATVGQLAAGIAHDFNNIMGVIILYTQMLEGGAHLTEKDHHRLGVIYEQAQHATSLIGQILDFSRRSIMERTQFDLLPLVKETVKLLERTLPESIALELLHDEKAYFVHSDPGRLQQALMNLAVNARDAMPKGGKVHFALSTITVAPNQVPPLLDMTAGQWVRLVVRDTGSGIPSADLPRIFEPFFTTKERGRGTGLGLAQVYGIVKQHGGAIDVRSEVGEGTTFVIYLPLLVDADPETAVTAVKETAPEGTETILLVEDETAMRLSVVEALTALGYQVLSTADGRSALEILAHSGDEIDLVLSDLVMPGVDGLELFRTVQEQNRQAKMMIMTGYPLGENEKLLQREGITDWVQKPFDMSALAVRVRQVLDKADAAG